MFWANRVAWTKRWTYWFAESLKLISYVDSYKSLLKRVRDPNKWEEALSVLEFSRCIGRTGIPIVFDRCLPNGKKPDVTFRISNFTCTAEVSRLNPSDFEIAVEEASKILTFMFIRIMHECSYAARILRRPTENEIEELSSFDDLINECTCPENKLFEESVGDWLEFAISPNENLKLLRKWAYDRGICLNSIDQIKPPIGDLIRRMGNKIEKKAKQLVSYNPSILILKNQQFLAEGGYIHDRVLELEPYLKSQTRLAVLIIYCSYLEPHLESVLVNYSSDHVFIERARTSFEAERWVLIPNPRNKTRGNEEVFRYLCNALSGQKLPHEKLYYQYQ